MKAVHFGAGNIGRGFVGLILHNAGYEVVFADVAGPLIEALSGAPTYRVNEVGEHPKTWIVDNYRALNSATDESAVIQEIATADIVTTAVGPNVLNFIGPVIAAAIVARPRGIRPLAVLACENALRATDILRSHVLAALDDKPPVWLDERAVFANTAVDRIVPAQEPGQGLDVTVEDFFEWAIEVRPFHDHPPIIPEAHFVLDLAPYIERKLFTVNTGHATVAYHGFLRSAPTLAEAMSDPEVAAEVRAVLGETASLLVRKHEFDPAKHDDYVQRTVTRFSNPYLPDTPARVGRQPLRKLSRNERFVSPAAEISQFGDSTAALVRAMGAGFAFDEPDDPESQQLKGLVRDSKPDDVTAQVTGLEPGTPLFDSISAEVAAIRS